MADNRDEWIKKRAYALWEEEGKPHGKDAEHWEQANREYSAFALTPARKSSTKRAETSTSTPNLPSSEAGKKKSPARKTSDQDSPEKKTATRRPKKPGASG